MRKSLHENDYNFSNWIFGLCLLSIPLLFLGNSLVMGLVLLLIGIHNIDDGLQNKVGRDFKWYVGIIFYFLFGILWFIAGILQLLDVIMEKAG